MIPIIGAILKSNRDAARSIKAIIIYPMNARVNNQLEEPDKFPAPPERERPHHP